MTAHLHNNEFKLTNMKKSISLLSIKNLLCTIASKMDESTVQNILARLGSKSPALFVRIQKVCLKIVGITGLWTTADQMGVIPAFQNKVIVSAIIGAIGVLALGIGGGASLPTTDPKLISQEVKNKVIDEAVNGN